MSYAAVAIRPQSKVSKHESERCSRGRPRTTRNIEAMVAATLGALLRLGKDRCVSNRAVGNHALCCGCPNLVRAKTSAGGCRDSGVGAEYQSARRTRQLATTGHMAGSDLLRIARHHGEGCPRRTTRTSSHGRTTRAHWPQFSECGIGWRLGREYYISGDHGFKELSQDHIS